VNLDADLPASLVVALDSVLAADVRRALRIEITLIIEKPTTPWQLRVLVTDADADLLVPDEIMKLAQDPRWQPAHKKDGEKSLWTDDFSNILSIFR